MELYNIYDFCSSVLFVVIAHLYVLFLLISCYSDTHDTHFLDIICIKCESFKGSVLWVSLVSILMSLIVLFSNNQFVIMLGCNDIRIMPDGTYCYYVYATNEKDKTYTLPANITKIDRLQYYIENVYFKNGGYLYFSDGDYFKYNDTFEEYDQNNRRWKIELTNYKTSHEKVDETKPFKPTSIIISFVEVFVIWLSTIIYILQLRKRKWWKI